MKHLPLAFGGTAVLLLGTTLLSGLTSLRVPDQLAVPLDQIDSTLAGWTAAGDQTLPAPTLRALALTAYLSRTYRKDQSNLDLFIAYYAEQRAGESMHSPKHCLPGAGWEILEYKTAQIPVDGRTYDVNQYIVSHESERMLILYWYQSKGRVIASEYMGKLLLARDTLLQHTTSGSIVRITIPDRPGALGAARDLATETIRQVSRSFGG